MGTLSLVSPKAKNNAAKKEVASSALNVHDNAASVPVKKKKAGKDRKSQPIRGGEEILNINHRKLLGRIVEYGYTNRRFAEALDYTVQTLTCKLAGVNPFTTKDIIKICKQLDIPKEDIHVYFFTENNTK
jgi:hypothetical protein